MANAAEAEASWSRRRRWETLYNATVQGDYDAVKAILGTGAGSSLDLNSRDVFQSCLIHIAAKRGDYRVVSLLIDHGANVLAVDFAGLRKTALHHAALLGGHKSPYSTVRTCEVLVRAIESKKGDEVGKSEVASVLQSMPWSGRSWKELIDKHGLDPILPPGSLALDDGRRPCAEAFGSGEAREGEERENPLVVMAITQPKWTRETSKRFPEAMKRSVRALLLLSRRITDGICLTEDLVAAIAEKAAYPLSDWITPDGDIV